MSSDQLSSRLKSRFSSTRKPSSADHDDRLHASHHRSTSTGSSNSQKSYRSAKSNGSYHSAAHSGSSLDSRHSHSRSSSSTSASSARSSTANHQKASSSKRPELPSIPSNTNLEVKPMSKLARKPSRLFGSLSRSSKGEKSPKNPPSTAFFNPPKPSPATKSTPVTPHPKKYPSSYFHEELLRSDCACDGCKHGKNSLSHKASKARLSHSHPYKQSNGTNSMDSLDTFANNILDIVSYNKRDVKWNF